MSDTWNGATREEFIGRVRGFSKRELADMMRGESKKLPLMPARSNHEELVGACFDTLVGKDSSAAAARAAAPSTPVPAAALRYEIRSRGVIQRWRCGHKFTNAYQTFPSGAFTREELAELRADSLIQVNDLWAGK